MPAHSYPPSQFGDRQSPTAWGGRAEWSSLVQMQRRSLAERQIPAGVNEASGRTLMSFLSWIICTNQHHLLQNKKPKQQKKAYDSNLLHHSSVSKNVRWSCRAIEISSWWACRHRCFIHLQLNHHPRFIMPIWTHSVQKGRNNHLVLLLT